MVLLHRGDRADVAARAGCAAGPGGPRGERRRRDDGSPLGRATELVVLEWIDEVRGAPSRSGSGTSASVGGAHPSGAETFGRADRRTTGSRGFPTSRVRRGRSSSGTQRLLPLARLARDGAAISPSSVRGLERLAARLEELGGPAEPPAQLHGDLWAGNRVVDTAGTSWILDPAAHGGHREFDLAMMRLFGGFGEDAFRGYDERAALAAGWEQRVALHQIAPLVVHAIKFGGQYRAAAEASIARYA
ncbi:MAG: fructosamine kinase family protein [Ilumatobacteraceae bacterium]